MMQVMDLFPQMMTKFDPAVTGYSKQGSKGGQKDTQFSDIMSSVRTANERPKSGDAVKGKSADATDRAPDTTRKETDAPEELKDTGEPMENDEEEADDVLAASVLAQSGVVLILEGNKEIDAASEAADGAIDEIGALTQGGAPVVEGDEVPVSQNTTAGDTGDGEAMEQMARMPETTEKPREASEKSDDGDLCPLENENEEEVSETKGKKDKSPRIAHSSEDKPVEDGDGEAQRVIPTNQTVDVRPERLSSTEQLKGVAAGQPVTQNNLFDAMVEKVETMQVDGMNKMSIQLKPEYLGKVSLELSMSQSGLLLKINADDINVKTAIGGQISALIETLSSKGVQVAQVEVVHTGVGSYDFTNGQGENAQPQKNAPTRRYAQTDEGDMIDFDALTADDAANMLDDEISSVEYRA